jgi:LysM repeat protein
MMSTGNAKEPSPENLAPAPTPSQPKGCGEHTIKSGDTFWQIAQDKGVQVSAIQAANPGVKAGELKVGQKINIPCSGGGELSGQLWYMSVL